MGVRGFGGEYAEKAERSLLVSEVQGVMNVAASLTPFTGGLVADAILSVTDVNGDVCAQIWWDGEAEQWVIDFGTGWEKT